MSWVTVHHGISLAEARQIAIDVTRTEILALQHSAIKTVQDRISHIADEITEEVRQRLNGDFSIFGEPDFQFILHNVGVSFAKTGDTSIEKLLVKLVGERATEKSRSAKQSILNEAIEICGKITERQLIILTSIFVPMHTIAEAKNLKELGAYLEETIAGPLKDFSEDELEFDHLEFSRCISARVAVNAKLIDYIRDGYAQFFANGIPEERIPSNLKGYLYDKDLFTISDDDQRKVYPISLNRDELKKQLALKPITEEDRKFLEELYTSFTFNKDITKKMIAGVSPNMNPIFEKWDRTQIENWQLTAVGKVLAMSYARYLKIDLDYGTWLK